MNIQGDTLLESYLGLLEAELDDSKIENNVKKIPPATFKKAKDSVSGIMDKIEKILKSKGINTEAIKKEAKKAGHKYHALYKLHERKKSDPRVVAKEITRNLFIDSKAVIKKTFYLSRELPIQVKLVAALLVTLLLYWFYHAMVVFSGNLFTFLPSMMAQQIASTVLIALAQESAKRYFATMGIPWAGVTIAFGFDFLRHALRFIISGGAITSALLNTGVKFGVHLITQCIHVMGYEFDSRGYAFALAVMVNVALSYAMMIYSGEIDSYIDQLTRLATAPGGQGAGDMVKIFLPDDTLMQAH